MNIPSKVRVGSIDYDVELTDETLVLNTQQSLGIIDYDNNKIRIANNIQSNQRQEQTFLHELVHAVTREFKIDFTEDEEVIVDKFAYGLHQVIRDNLPSIVDVRSISKEINTYKHDINSKILEIQFNEENICINKDTRRKYFYEISLDPYLFNLIDINYLLNTSIKDKEIFSISAEKFKEKYEILNIKEFSNEFVDELFRRFKESIKCGACR